VMKTGDKIALWGLVIAVVTGLIGLAAWRYPKSSDPATAEQPPSSVNRTAANQQPTPDNPTETTDDGGSTDNAPVTPKTGKITLTETYSVILDSESLNWDVHWGCGTCDLWLQGDLSAGYGGALVPLANDDGGTYKTCAGATAYVHAVSSRTIKPGLRLCVRTTNGNFALVAVTEVDRESGSVTANVTSWIEH
jgi:hypothetical protein